MRAPEAPDLPVRNDRDSREAVEKAIERSKNPHGDWEQIIRGTTPRKWPAAAHDHDVALAKSPQPFEAQLIVRLEPWAQHFPENWTDRLVASLGSIHQTTWDRPPRVVANGPRIAFVTLDTYGFTPVDACQHARVLLKLHLDQAGLMENTYSVSAACSLRN